jgi:NAD(P)H-nitrite reductase large subunit
VRTRIAIIGNSAAALSAIRAIRQRSVDHSITLVSREDCCAYSPALTTHYLSDRMSKEKLFMVDESFYRRSGFECILGREVVELDHNRQTVVLDDGKRIDYDRVLVATGASPKVLQAADAGRAGRHTLSENCGGRQTNQEVQQAGERDPDRWGGVGEHANWRCSGQNGYPSGLCREFRTSLGAER